MQQIDGKAQGNEEIGDGSYIVWVYVVNIRDHMADIPNGMIHIVCPEEDPCKGYQQESEEDLKRFFERRIPFPGRKLISHVRAILAL
jgi:hypothetical protein